MHRFWHITLESEFSVDPDKGGFDAWGTRAGPTKDLFLADEQSLELWSWHSYLKGREWVAEVDVRDSIYWKNRPRLNPPDEYRADPKKVRVVKVWKLEDAVREATKHQARIRQDKQPYIATDGREFKFVRRTPGLYGKPGYVWIDDGTEVPRPARYDALMATEMRRHGPNYRGRL